MHLTGNLEDLGLGEIFQILSFSGKSGALRLRSARMEGLVVFREGNVIKAVSSVLKESVGDLLVKEAAISSRQLDSAKEIQNMGGFAEPLGKILERNCALGAGLVDTIAQKQIERAVHQFFFWQAGYFTFELGDYAETPAVIRADTLQHTLAKGLNPQYLAMEGLRLLDESKKSPQCGPEASRLTDEMPEHPSVKSENAPGPEKMTRPEGEIDTRRYAEELLKEIGDDGGFPDCGAQASAVATSKGLKMLKEMLDELTRPLSLNEIVLLILRFSSEIINRSVVFTVKNSRLVGFGQSGIELNGEISECRVRKMSIPAEEPSILMDAINEKSIVVKQLDSAAWNDYIIGQLGGLRPVEAFAAPVVVRGRVVMILYGDNGEQGLGDISTLDIFLAQTGVAIERIVSNREAAAREGYKAKRDASAEKRNKRAIL